VDGAGGGMYPGSPLAGQTLWLSSPLYTDMSSTPPPKHKLINIKLFYRKHKSIKGYTLIILKL
jgi:hypothetical protein